MKRYSRHARARRHGRGVRAVSALADLILEGCERLLSRQKYLAGDQVALAHLTHLPYGVVVEQYGFSGRQKLWEGLQLEGD